MNVSRSPKFRGRRLSQNSCAALDDLHLSENALKNDTQVSEDVYVASLTSPDEGRKPLTCTMEPPAGQQRQQPQEQGRLYQLVHYSRNLQWGRSISQLYAMEEL